MRRAIVVSDSPNRARDIVWCLSSVVPARAAGMDDLERQSPTSLTIIAADLCDHDRVDRLRRWLQMRPSRGTVFALADRTKRVEVVRAYAVGATDVLSRPCSPDELLSRVRAVDEMASVRTTVDNGDGVGAAIAALTDIFLTATTGAALNMAVLTQAADTVISRIESHGFASWVKAARNHHDQTYQHSMLVCGSAAAFGQHLGFNAADRRRVALAGLLHDIGKAQIDLEILSKDAKLNDIERAVMNQHPDLGYRVLREDSTLEPEILDTILHHHEYLDGSGYPGRLRGTEVSDLTRVITITDIFSALIERRAYKAPLCGPDAFQILVEMAGKLDQDLVRAFQPLSRAQFS